MTDQTDQVFTNDADHLDLTEESNELDRSGESAGGKLDPAVGGDACAAAPVVPEEWRIFPCRAKSSTDVDKDGYSLYPAKKPLIKWKDEANWSNDPEQLATWGRKFPGYMQALPTGEINGIWVLDLDIHYDFCVDEVNRETHKQALKQCFLEQRDFVPTKLTKDDVEFFTQYCLTHGLKSPEVKIENGIENFKRYCSEHGHEFPKTLTVITPSGGLHLYFIMPIDGTDIRNSAGEILPGVDVRGTGGYVIKPPSMNQDTGKSYEWENPSVPIAEAEQWLVELVTKKKEKSAPSLPVAQAAGPVADVGALGEKIADIWEAKIAEIRSAKKGRRNPTLNENAFCLYGLAKAGKLTKEFIDLALWDAAHAMKSPLPEKEIRDTLASAWKGAGAWPTGAVEVDDLAEDESIGGDEIQTRPMDWLWKGVFIRKAVNLINGKGGRGKSQLRARITAHVTTGTPWPDGSPCPQGKVLIVCLEDSLEEIEKPRLMAAGADVSLCRFLYGHKTISTIKKDIRKIEATIIKHGITVLFVDPLLGYTNDVTNKDIAAAREVVDLLTELAARHNLAVIAINHITKGGGNAGFDPMDRISGNSGIGHAARTSWFVTKDTEDPRSNRRLFLCGKNNPSLDTIGFSFTIEPATVETDEGPCEISRAVWEESMVDIDAAYALNRDEKLMIRNGDGEPQNEKERAAAFLLEVLADGPVDSNRIKEMGKDADISWRTIWRAKEDLSIKCKRVIDEGGTRWQWSINEAASTPDWVDNITVKGRSVPSMPTVPSIPYKENGTVDGTERTMPASVPNGLYGKVGTLGTDGTVEPNTGTPIPPATTTDSKLQGVDI